MLNVATKPISPVLNWAELTNYVRRINKKSHVVDHYVIEREGRNFTVYNNETSIEHEFPCNQEGYQLAYAEMFYGNI